MLTERLNKVSPFAKCRHRTRNDVHYYVYEVPILDAIIISVTLAHTIGPIAINFVFKFQTAPSLASHLYCLATNPDKQDKLYCEICHVVGEGTRPLTSDLINQMTYLKACVKEAFRYDSDQQIHTYMS